MDKPLLAHTIEQANNSNLFDTIIVSTDSQDYAEIAIKYGAQVPFLRPSSLSTSEIPTSEVTLHILRSLLEKNITYDYFAVLQPTSPLRSVQDLIDSFLLMQEKKSDVIISVSLSNHPPEWSNILKSDLSLKNFIPPEIRNKPRQQLPQRYTIHGAIFWARTEAYLKNQDPYSMDSVAYIMPQERAVDIDTITEFYLAEILYKERLRNNN